MHASPSRLLVLSCLVLLTVGACADEPDALDDGGGDGTSAGGSGVGAGGGPVATPSGLPCDVASVLAARCTSCHSDPPRSSAPQPLVTREQLLAPSTIDPSMSQAERSVLRMRAGTMPASGGAEADADVIEAWLEAGAPAGTCGEGGGSGEDPFAQPSACVSGQTWWSDEEGDDMNPGQACNACHRREAAEGENDAPILVVGGTVYPNGHAPDDCWGIDGLAGPYASIEVWITDAAGTTHRLGVGRTGNFLLEEAEGFTAPYTAKVVDVSVDPPAERVMVEPQTDGDCNLCHTESGFGDGSDAPGRIMVP